MRVVSPQERKTNVELNDREIQLITRALYLDGTNDDENGDLFTDFSSLETDLGLNRLR